MKLYIIILLQLSTVIVIKGCTQKNECTKCDNFTEKVFWEIYNSVDSISTSININYDHVEFPNNLYENSQFEKIIENICSSKKQLVKIALHDTSAIKKEISLLALQHLCVDDYLMVLKQLYSSYEQGKLKKEYFIFSIRTKLSDVLIINYENKRLENFIGILLQDSTFTEAEKQYFLKIRSGEIWQKKKNSPPS